MPNRVYWEGLEASIGLSLQSFRLKSVSACKRFAKFDIYIFIYNARLSIIQARATLQIDKALFVSQTYNALSYVSYTLQPRSYAHHNNSVDHVCSSCIFPHSVQL